MDAARYISSDVSGIARNSQPKVYKDVHFWRRCVVYFKRLLDDDIYNLIRHNDNLFRLFIAEEALRTICF